MEFDKFDNKTIIIVGLIACGIISLFLNYENVASMTIGALGGVLTAKGYDAYTQYKENNHEEGLDDI